MQSQTIIIYTDGGSRGNPGNSAYGFVIKDSTGKNLAERGEYIGIHTNNFAEYTAVISSLEWLKTKSIPITSIQLYLDSELIARQLSGQYKVKNPGLFPLFNRVITLIKEIGVPFTATHIPREKNYEADALVNKALDLVN